MRESPCPGVAPSHLIRLSTRDAMAGLIFHGRVELVPNSLSVDTNDSVCVTDPLYVGSVFVVSEVEQSLLLCRGDLHRIQPLSTDILSSTIPM